MGNEQEIYNAVLDRGSRKLVLADSMGHAGETIRGNVLVGGSHMGINGGEYLAQFGPRGIISNDGGKGLNNAGVASLPVFDKHGIAAAAVSSMSAKIGNATSTYEQGVISIANETAKRLGIREGMPAKEAVELMLAG